MQTEKQRGIKPRKEEDNDAIRSEEGHQPFSCFRSLSSQNRWNYIVCAKCPKVNMYCDIFLLWLCRAALLFSHLHNLKRWESRQHCLLLSAFIEPIHRRVSNLFSDPMPKCHSHHIFSTEYYHFCFRMSDRESLTVFSQSFHFLETPRGHLLSYCCRMYRYVLL